MRKYNRINKSDRTREKQGKTRIVLRGFMGYGLDVNKRVKRVILKIEL